MHTDPILETFDPDEQARHRKALAAAQGRADFVRSAILFGDDVALPQANVTPRLTTAQAIAQVLADAERGRPAQEMLSVRHSTTGSSPAAKHSVTFGYLDGSSVTFGPHS